MSPRQLVCKQLLPRMPHVAADHRHARLQGKASEAGAMKEILAALLDSQKASAPQQGAISIEVD